MLHQMGGRLQRFITVSKAEMALSNSVSISRLKVGILALEVTVVRIEKVISEPSTGP